MTDEIALVATTLGDLQVYSQTFTSAIFPITNGQYIWQNWIMGEARRAVSLQ